MLAGVSCVFAIFSIAMLVEKGPEVTRGGTTICQGRLNSRLHYILEDRYATLHKLMISSGTKLTEDYILGCVKDVMQLCKQKRMENISQASQGRPCRPKYYKCQKFRYKAVKYLNQQQEDDNSGNHSSNSQSS